METGHIAPSSICDFVRFHFRPRELPSTTNGSLTRVVPTAARALNISCTRPTAGPDFDACLEFAYARRQYCIGNSGDRLCYVPIDVFGPRLTAITAYSRTNRQTLCGAALPCDQDAAPLRDLTQIGATAYSRQRCGIHRPPIDGQACDRITRAVREPRASAYLRLWTKALQLGNRECGVDGIGNLREKIRSALDTQAGIGQISVRLKSLQDRQNGSNLIEN